MGTQIVAALFIGIGATLIMDLIALGLQRGFGIQPLNYALVGRWCAYLLRGKVIHRPIGQSPAVFAEAPLGWGAHYLIGVALAAGFLIWVGPDWLRAPGPGPALAFGALTVALPFLILQPGMGAGLAARRTPRPWVARAKSLLAHLSFGVGLWLAGLGWAAAH